MLKKLAILTTSALLMIGCISAETVIGELVSIQYAFSANTCGFKLLIGSHLHEYDVYDNLSFCQVLTPHLGKTVTISFAPDHKNPELLKVG